MKILATILLLAATNYAHASVNKCVDSKGKITFTDAVCKPDQAASIVKIRPINTIDSTPAKRAIYQVHIQEQEQRHQQAVANSQRSYKYSLDRSRATSYNSNTQQNNSMRKYNSTSPLPSLGTGKGCYKESNQYICY